MHWSQEELATMARGENTYHRASLTARCLSLSPSLNVELLCGCTATKMIVCMFRKMDYVIANVQTCKGTCACKQKSPHVSFFSLQFFSPPFLRVPPCLACTATSRVCLGGSHGQMIPRPQRQRLIFTIIILAFFMDSPVGFTWCCPVAEVTPM